MKKFLCFGGLQDVRAAAKNIITREKIQRIFFTSHDERATKTRATRQQIIIVKK